MRNGLDFDNYKNYFIAEISFQPRFASKRKQMQFIIHGFHSIPADSNDKDVAAMLDELTIEANEESFVIVLQHGGNDVT